MFSSVWFIAKRSLPHTEAYGAPAVEAPYRALARRSLSSKSSPDPSPTVSPKESLQVRLREAYDSSKRFCLPTEVLNQPMSPNMLAWIMRPKLDPKDRDIYRKAIQTPLDQDEMKRLSAMYDNWVIDWIVRYLTRVGEPDRAVQYLSMLSDKHHRKSELSLLVAFSADQLQLLPNKPNNYSKEDVVRCVQDALEPFMCGKQKNDIPEAAKNLLVHELYRAQSMTKNKQLAILGSMNRSDGFKDHIESRFGVSSEDSQQIRAQFGMKHLYPVYRYLFNNCKSRQVQRLLDRLPRAYGSVMILPLFRAFALKASDQDLEGLATQAQWSDLFLPPMPAITANVPSSIIAHAAALNDPEIAIKLFSKPLLDRQPGAVEEISWDTIRAIRDLSISHPVPANYYSRLATAMFKSGFALPRSSPNSEVDKDNLKWIRGLIHEMVNFGLSSDGILEDCGTIAGVLSQIDQKQYIRPLMSDEYGYGHIFEKFPDVYARLRGIIVRSRWFNGPSNQVRARLLWLLSTEGLGIYDRFVQDVHSGKYDPYDHPSVIVEVFEEFAKLDEPFEEKNRDSLDRLKEVCCIQGGSNEEIASKLMMSSEKDALELLKRMPIGQCVTDDKLFEKLVSYAQKSHSLQLLEALLDLSSELGLEKCSKDLRASVLLNLVKKDPNEAIAKFEEWYERHRSNTVYYSDWNKLIEQFAEVGLEDAAYRLFERLACIQSGGNLLDEVKVLAKRMDWEVENKSRRPKPKRHHRAKHGGTSSRIMLFDYNRLG